jgi:hypothetical protein
LASFTFAVIGDFPYGEAQIAGFPGVHERVLEAVELPADRGEGGVGARRRAALDVTEVVDELHRRVAVDLVHDLRGRPGRCCGGGRGGGGERTSDDGGAREDADRTGQFSMHGDPWELSDGPRKRDCRR